MSSSPVLIVTGASSGLGRSVAKLAITNFNARVVAIARRKDLLESLQKELPEDKQNNMSIANGNVTDGNVLQLAVDQAINKWQRIDAIVANAGTLEPVARVKDGSMQEWRELFEVNFFSVVQLVQAALPHLRKSKGTILLVSSGAAAKPYKGWAPYGASKAALNHLGATLAVEEPEITTISLRPGVVNTDMQNKVRSLGEGVMENDYDKFKDLYASGKLIDPDQPGHVIASLCIAPQKHFSGQFLSWDDDILLPHRLK